MSRVLTELDREYWASEVQETLFVENTALYLAGGEAQSHLSNDGKKFHKPIISKPRTGSYTPYEDIEFKTKSAEDQELEADQMDYAAEEIDDVDAKQNYYDALGHAGRSMQRQLNNRIEQYFNDQIEDAKHNIDARQFGGSSGSPASMSTSNINKLFTGSHTIMDSVDAPMHGRTSVIGAHTLGIIRDYKGERETGYGDNVLQNGIVGPFQGWELVYNNNLPWSAEFKIDNTPTDGDTVTIAGVTFTFKDTLGNDAGNVLIGGSAAGARANLKKAVEAGDGAGSDYVEIGGEDRFILSEKRRVTCTSAEDMVFKGYGDIVVSASQTASSHVWSEQTQKSMFMVRGAIDLVVQLGKTVEITRKEKGFADLIKSLSLYGAKMFDDGAMVSIEVDIDASDWV